MKMYDLYQVQEIYRTALQLLKFQRIHLIIRHTALYLHILFIEKDTSHTKKL